MKSYRAATALKWRRTRFTFSPSGIEKHPKEALPSSAEALSDGTDPGDPGIPAWGLDAPSYLGGLHHDPGADATGACPNPANGPILMQVADLLEIGVPNAPGFVVGVAHVVSHVRRLPAEFTLSTHVLDIPFRSEMNGEITAGTVALEISPFRQGNLLSQRPKPDKAKTGGRSTQGN